MSRKTLMAVALAAGLAMVFAAIPAEERSRQSIDRTKQGPLARTSADTNKIPYYPEFDPNAGKLSAIGEGDGPADVAEALDPRVLQDRYQLGLTNPEQAVGLGRAYLFLSRQQEPQQAMATLSRVLDLDVATMPGGAELLADTHRRMAELLELPSRKAYHLQQALWLTDDADARAELADQIVSQGGVVHPGTFSEAASLAPRTFGLYDLCTSGNTPPDLDVLPVGIPSTTSLTISDPFVFPGFIVEDSDYLTFDIPLVEPGNPFDPLVGAIVRIETKPSDPAQLAACQADENECKCPNNGENCPFDTALALYAECSDDGFGELRVGFDQGPGDSGLGFYATIDGRGTCMDPTGKRTGERCFVDSDCVSSGGPNSQGFCMNALCLPAGTYYVEAMGDFGNAPKDFDVEITQIGTCPIPRGDNFEVDDTRPEAIELGWPNSLPSQSKHFGRANKEIAERTITVRQSSTDPPFPIIDQDHVKVSLGRDELVRFSTAVTQPRPKNAQFYRPADQGEDTQMQILFRDEPNGGLCNHNATRTGGSFVSLGCRIDPTQNNFGIPGLGPDLDGKCYDITPENQAVLGFGPRFFAVPTNWCIPNWLVSFIGEGCGATCENFFRLGQTANDLKDATYWSHPLIRNDNVDVGMEDFGSKIELCVPRDAGGLDLSAINGLADNELVSRITTSENQVRAPLLNYFYEARAENLAPCTFEREPNQSPFDASPLPIDEEGYGIWNTAEGRNNNTIVCLDASEALGIGIPGCDFPIVTPEFSSDPFFGIPCPNDQCGDRGFTDFDWWGPFDIAAADVNTDEGICFGNQALACAGAGGCAGVCETDFCDEGACNRGGGICFEDSDCASTCANAPSIECDDEMGMPSDELCDFGTCILGAEVGFRLTPSIIDPQADSELDLWAGPDDAGNFYVVASEGFDECLLDAPCDDVEGNEPNSPMDIGVLPPAAELLAAAGIPAMSPNYYLVAYGAQGSSVGFDAGGSVPNWYYKVSAFVVRPIPETEPNGDCQLAFESANVGDRFIGTLTPGCDYDTFRLNVPEATAMTISTDGDPSIIDSTVQIEDCNAGEVLSCDDDSGPAFLSLITGCLAPGDYCVRVRAFAGANSGSVPYTITFDGAPGCDPGPLTGDFLFGCDENSSAGGFDSFCGQETTVCGQ